MADYSLAARQKAEREHVRFVWDLHAQREEHSNWIDGRDVLTCPVCFSQVRWLLRSAHEEKCHE